VNRTDAPGSLTPHVWAEIRAGRAPDHEVVGRVAQAERAVLGAEGQAAAMARLASSVLGAGPLDALLDDPAVTDIAVNADGTVWVDRGEGMRSASANVGDAAAVRRLAVRLAGLAGRRLDDSAAYVDGLLPTGVRLHAILPPLAPDGAHVTLRVPARRALTLGDLAAAEMFPSGWERVLRALVRRKVSFVISGGTGAGKTTLLAAMLGTADPSERVVVIEDARELALDRPHVVRLEGRAPNVEGVGEVTMVTLVRQALRMRPDRLVIGEVRGAEVRELLAALNTGHDGGCGTVHANAAVDVVARFEALGALAGLSTSALHAQVASAVQAVVHVRRRSDGRRIIDSIGVLLPDARGKPFVLPALVAGRGASELDPAAREMALGRLRDLVGAIGVDQVGGQGCATPSGDAGRTSPSEAVQA
jgi:pilus assembly protein CpaF